MARRISKSKSYAKSGATAVKAVSGVGKSLMWLYILICIPLFGFQAAAHETLGQLNPVDGSKLERIWEVFKLTAPLSLSITLIALAVIRDWFEGIFLYLFGFGVLILFTLVLHPTGWELLSRVFGEERTGNPVITYSFALMTEYILTYTWQYFVSSFIIGLFLAWFWNWKVLSFFNEE